MEAKKKEGYTLDVLVREDKDRSVFVAQCLQFDIAVQAPTMEKLKERFSHVFAAYIVEEVKSGKEPLSTLNKAPRRFWDMFLRGSVEDRDLPIYVESSGRPVNIDFRANFSKVIAAAEARA